MRFSDMMGSGAERPEKGSAPEPDAVIADALAPYLDAASREAESVAPVAPVVSSARGSIDYPPLSDDLLPRRR